MIVADQLRFPVSAARTPCRDGGIRTHDPLMPRTLRLTFSQVSMRASSQVLFAKALDVHDRANRVVPRWSP